MNIAIAELNYVTGDFEANTQKILGAIKEAKLRNADLVVFAELAICGYPPRDFLEFEDFIESCHASLELIRKASAGIAIIVGCPSFNSNPGGKNLFNSAYFIHDQEVKNVIHKTLLPTYDIFDEYRYFEANTDFGIVELDGLKIAVTICEDTWNLGRFAQYPVTPMDVLIKESPDVMINIAASPFSYQQQATREEMLRLNVAKYGIPILYVNHVGAQTELIFDGNSMAMNANGEIAHQTIPFEETIDMLALNGGEFVSIDEGYKEGSSKSIELMFNALVLGVRDYFRKLGFKTATLGLSGGVDSALVAVIAAKALGPENVLALLMPSQFSSDHSVNDAIELAANLGIQSKKIEIESVYSAFESKLSSDFQGLPFNVAEENIQARIRGTLLMAFSNKFGHILLNTSNKSELAVGYGTLYGDMAGGLSVIGDVYKTQAYDMCNWINRSEEIIPNHIIVKPPSAELRPNQKDSDSLPDYAILDRLLFEYIENRLSPQELIEKGFEKDLVARVLKMVNQNEYKRHQTPPILRVSPKAFGMGRRMPIVAKYLA